MTAGEIETVAQWPVSATPRRIGVALGAASLPLFASALVLIRAATALSPVRDAQTGVADGSLRLQPAYITLAPLCNILDAMSTLSVRQHVALVVTMLALYAVWRVRALRVRRAVRRRRALREACGALGTLAAIVATYALGTLVDRPMAALELSRPDELSIDFHSHTDASWDARRRFTDERNRSWHRDAGFDVVYLSDHLPDSGAIAPLLSPGRRAGAGTVLLPALEIRCHGIHVVFLGATAAEARERCTDPPEGDELTRAISERRSSIVAIATLPARLEVIAHADVDAVELVDGAPRAFDQLARDRDTLVALAARRDLALISGSNLHGWGRTASAWSVMEIRGWRTMTPEALDVVIRRRLHEARSHAVRVIERRRVDPGSSLLSLASTAPAVAWNLLAALSVAERLSWIAWIWAAWLAVRILRGGPR